MMCDMFKKLDYIGDNAAHFWLDLHKKICWQFKNLCRCRQVRTDPYLTTIYLTYEYWSYRDRMSKLRPWKTQSSFP